MHFARLFVNDSSDLRATCDDHASSFQYLSFFIENLSTPKRIFHAEHAHTVATADAFIRQYFIEIN